MSAPARALALGETLPDVSLQRFDGEPAVLSALRGRPLLIVCVRYYG